MGRVVAFASVLTVALVVTFLAASDRTADESTELAGVTDTGPATGEPSAAPADEPTPGDAATATPDDQPETSAEPTPSPAAVGGESDDPGDGAPESGAPGTSFTMTFSGDVLSHGSVIRQAAAHGTAELAHDYRPLFAPVQDRLSAADLSLCVLETPVSSDNVALSGYPIFNAPRELPDGLAAVGFDGCATASNHSFDKGPAGVASTLDQMDRVGLGHAGMARSAEEKASPTIYEVNGVDVAHLSYTYGLNGFVLPPDQPYLVNVTDPDAILAEAAAARAAGADFVVVSLQWGLEYVQDPTPDQAALAEQLTASPDIDLIVGNHAHVIQPITTVNDKTVVYGLGNFLSNQSAECCPANTQDGVIVTVTVSGSEADGYAVSDVAFTPTWVDRSNYTVIDLVEALADPGLDDGTRALYQTSYDRTTEVINRLGAGLQPS